MSTSEFDKVNEYVYNKFDKLIIKHNVCFPKDMSYENICNRIEFLGNRPQMIHNPDDMSTNIIPILEKNIINTQYLKSDTQNLYDKLIYMPILKCALTGNVISKQEYYDIYIKSKLKRCYDNQYPQNSAIDFRDGMQLQNGTKNKKFIEELLQAIEQDNKQIKSKQTKQNVKKPKENDTDQVKAKKKKPISATIKRLVWNTHIGEEIGKAKCLCCNATDITQMSFNCGHMIAEANGGETIVSNLKPICQNCNSSMGTKNMDEFMKSLK